MTRLLIPLVGLTLISGAWAKEESVSLTVYNQDFGFVKLERDLELNEGQNQLDFKDVAATIDRTSVHFKSLTDPEGTVIMEQNFEYDLVSSTRMFEKYLGKEISLKNEKGETYVGVLGSYDGGQIVLIGAKVGDKQVPVAMIRQDQLSDVRFPELPEGFITVPTLRWLLNVAKAGTHRAEVSYIANAINWSADYNAVLEPDDKKMDLVCWITVDNRTGATYKNAQLKLMAGEVHRVQDVNAISGRLKMSFEADMAMAPPVQEKEFFEYHLYTVTRPVTIKDRQVKQIEFDQCPGVPVQKKFFMESPNVYAQEATQKVDIEVKVEFRNDEKSGMGIPLPQGRVRLFKRDDEGGIEFIGEDRIGHTPKDEKVSLKVGKAFDIVGERKQMNFEETPQYFRETYQVTVRNHKKEQAQVTVREKFYRFNEWKLTTSYPYQKVDSRTAEFVLDIPKDATGEFEYTVRYEKH